jgi:hypothetical protein
MTGCSDVDRPHTKVSCDDDHAPSEPRRTGNRPQSHRRRLIAAVDEAWVMSAATPRPPNRSQPTQKSREPDRLSVAPFAAASFRRVSRIVIGQIGPRGERHCPSGVQAPGSVQAGRHPATEEGLRRQGSSRVSSVSMREGSLQPGGDTANKGSKRCRVSSRICQNELTERIAYTIRANAESLTAPGMQPHGLLVFSLQ